MISKAEYVSDCCGAPMYGDYDICSSCQEHASGCGVCERCMGKGEVMGESSKQACPECEGEGSVIIEI